MGYTCLVPLQHYTLITPPEFAGLRIDQALAQWLPEASGHAISKAKVRQLIVAGAVYLNGHRVRIASKTLIVRARLEVHIDWKKLEKLEVRAQVPALSAQSILYEDDALIVVNKPAGLPTQPTLDEARSNLYGDLKAWLAAREGRSVAETYLGLHHRLDRDTSGAILFTKRKEANFGIAEQFKQHQIRKVYQALTERPVGGGGARREGETWKERNYLGRVSRRGKAAMFGAVRSGGDLAETDFKVLGAYARGLWVEAKPLTGRTHQIRVHLAEVGMSILGDFLYGRAASAPRLMLHAATLTLRHPLTQNELAVQSPLPEDFRQCLATLTSSPKAG